MPMRLGPIVAVTSSSLSFEYSRRVSTCPLASKPTKWTDALARSRPIVATSFSTLLRDGCLVDAMLVLCDSHATGNRFNALGPSPTFSRVLDSEAFCPFGVDG